MHLCSQATSYSCTLALSHYLSLSLTHTHTYLCSPFLSSKKVTSLSLSLHSHLSPSPSFLFLHSPLTCTLYQLACIHTHTHALSLPLSLALFKPYGEFLCVAESLRGKSSSSSSIRSGAAKKLVSLHLLQHKKRFCPSPRSPLSRARPELLPRPRLPMLPMPPRLLQQRPRVFSMSRACIASHMSASLSLCLARILLRHPLPVGEKLLSRLPRLDLFFLELQLIKIK